jgi:hypothetical protein
MSWAVRVVRNRYVDSVRLMQVAQACARRRRARARSRWARRRTSRALGVDCDATPDRRRDRRRGGGDGALDAAEAELAAAPPATARGREPAAVAAGPPARERRADLAARRVRGARGAPRADRGMHVFLFSDHVRAADEVALKRRGAERGCS